MNQRVKEQGMTIYEKNIRDISHDEELILNDLRTELNIITKGVVVVVKLYLKYWGQHQYKKGYKAAMKETMKQGLVKYKGGLKK